MDEWHNHRAIMSEPLSYPGSFNRHIGTIQKERLHWVIIPSRQPPSLEEFLQEKPPEDAPLYFTVEGQQYGHRSHSIKELFTYSSYFYAKIFSFYTKNVFGNLFDIILPISVQFYIY